MNILGVGTDLVSIVRFQRLIESGGRRFLAHWFTQTEIEYCLARAAPAQHAAARFAAKEAVVKSLRTVPAGPVRWREIEISRDENGLPEVHLHGAIRASAMKVGATRFHASLAHDADYATATVVAVADGAVSPPNSDVG